MRSRPVIAGILIVALVAGILYWRGASGVNQAVALEKRLAGLFSKFNLTDNNIVRKSLKEKVLGRAKYLQMHVEYNAPSSFSWKSFEPALKKELSWTSFRVTDADQEFKKYTEVCTVTISRGKFAIFMLKINRKKAAALPAVTKVYKNPRIAVVMDDFGYNMNDFDTLFGMKQPVTLSILPGQRYSRQIATLARSRGYEVILHLPLEAHRKDVPEESDTIKSGMAEKDIVARLAKELESVPGADGVSNHQGSKSTEDRKLMTSIIKYLKTKGLYFFDSLTSQKSVCREAAKSARVRYARRDLFLDNSNEIASIEKQVMDLRNMAFTQGDVIAVCHDRKNTITVLSRMMPEMAREGIKFVSLSEMVE